MDCQHGLSALHAFIKTIRASFEAANSGERVGARNKSGFVYRRNPSLIIDNRSMHVINEVVYIWNTKKSREQT